MKAIHFGAGKIGRGFIGAMLCRSGYDLCFVDASKELVDLINTQKGYTIHIMDERCYDEKIGPVSAMVSSSPELPGAMAAADIVTTAVSMKVLPIIAPDIAAGIKARMQAGVSEPLSVICCENGVRATSQLKSYVLPCLDEAEKEWAEGHIAFVDSCVDHIVPQISFDNPLDVASEQFEDWTVDRSQFKGELPPVKGMNFSDDLASHVERKLYTVNTGHCSIGYLGMMKGYKYIYEALSDPVIMSIIREELHQSGEALRHKFGFPAEEHEKYINMILNRFLNPNLKDTTARVGRDPMRKLGPTLYFSYPLALAASYGLPCDYLVLASAAGFRCYVEDDPQSVQIKKMIDTEGLKQTIAKVTMHKDSALVDEIAVAYEDVEEILFGKKAFR